MKLTGIQDLIFSDRYALKDPHRNPLQGSKVVVLISNEGQWEQRAIGRVVSVNQNLVKIKVEETGEIIERPITAVDVCLEEEPSQMWDRMAKWLSIKTEDGNFEEEFRDILEGFKFIPGGRINANLGSEELKNIVQMPEGFDGIKNTLMNCYLSAIKPEDPTKGKDSREAIMDTLKKMVSGMSLGGGWGIPLSVLRPNKGYIQGVNGRSSGSVSWGSLFSEATALISQGGCVAGGEEILTNKGKVKAKDLYERMKAGERFKALTHEGERDITTAFYNGKKPVYKVSTAKSERSIKASTDHKMGYSDNGEIKTKPLRDIKVGDEILMFDAHSFHPLFSDVVTNIKILNEEDVYDFEVQQTHMLAISGFYTSNSRRGALILNLYCNHPDIIEFIFSKLKPAELPEIKSKWAKKFPNANFITHGIENANISVLITDEFMEAVKEDRDWELIFPDYEKVSADVYNSEWEGDIRDWKAKGRPVKVYDVVKARDLWDCIMESNWRSAEPGVIFIDRMKEEHNGEYYAKILGTNPCLHKDTFMVTYNGLEKISQIEEKSYIWNGKGYTFGEPKAWVTGVKPVCKVTTKSGFEYVTTLDHKFLLYDREWCEAKDLEGKHLTFELMERFWEGVNPRPWEMYDVLGSELVQEGTHEVVLPDWIMKLPKYEMREFLEGIFREDYRVNKKRYSSCNKPFLQKLQQMLLLYGIKLDLVSENLSPELTIYHLVYNKRCKDFIEGKPLEQILRQELMEEVVSVELFGEAEVWDFHEKHYHRGVTGGVFVHNCGEIPLPSEGACLLGHITLPKFIEGNIGQGKVNWEELSKVIRNSARFLDDIIDYNPYHDKENEERQRTDRRIGLGTLGLGEFLIRAGIRYGKEGLPFIEELYKFIAIEAYKASIDLAEEKGAFPAFDYDKYIQSGFMERLLPELPKEYKEKLRTTGIRNVCVLCAAPTGSTGSMVGTSTGIEPYFSLKPYTRSGRLGTKTVQEKIVQQYLDENGLEDSSSLPAYFLDAEKIEPKDHILVQGTIQKWVDGSISKTCNLPESATINDVKEIYELAYELGVKGTTVFRANSRDVQVLSSISTSEKEEEEPSPGKIFTKRPNVVTGQTEKIKMPNGKLYVTVNSTEEDGVVEVFLNGGEHNAEINALMGYIGRLISMARKFGIPLKDIVKQGVKIPGGESFWYKGALDEKAMVLKNIPSAVSHVLGRFLKEKVKTDGDCPKCGGRMRSEEGCCNCVDCGFSKCS